MKLKKMAKRIDTRCCTHYDSGKYYLAYYGDTSLPLAYCENCGETQFVGNVFQFYLFKFLSCLDEDGFQVKVTNILLLDCGSTKENNGKQNEQ